MGSEAPRQDGPVDLVHLAGNLGEYTGWKDPEWLAFVALAIPGDDNVSFPEAQLCLYHCLKTGLNPLHKEIYFIRRKGKLVPQVSITGFHKMAHDTKCYRGMVAVEWCGKDKVWTDVWDAETDGVPLAARAGVLHKDFSEPFYAVAVFTEYLPKNDKEAFMWKKMPAHMIAKCAKALALREVFPSLSGYYTEDEMDQAGRSETKVTVREEPQEKPNRKKQQTKAKKKVSEKTKRYRYLVGKVKKKFPSLDDEGVNEWIRRFADKRSLLTVCPDKKRGSIAASSMEQIEALIKAVNEFHPAKAQAISRAEQSEPNDDEVCDAEYTIRVDVSQAVNTIEEYEAHLSQIPDPDERGKWQAAELVKALQQAPQRWPRVAAGDVFGEIDKDGAPVPHKWSDGQILRWYEYLEAKIADEGGF